MAGHDTERIDITLPRVNSQPVRPKCVNFPSEWIVKMSRDFLVDRDFFNEVFNQFVQFCQNLFGSKF